MKKIKFLLLILAIIIILSGCDMLGIKLDEISTTSDPTKATVISSSAQATTQTSKATTQSTTSQTTTMETSGSTSSTTVKGEMTDLVIYLVDNKGYVIPVTLSVEKTFQVATTSINLMISNNENDKLAAKYSLSPILPIGTEVKALSIDNGVATIDFNSKILDYTSKTEEYNIFSSIIYMLTGFSTIDTVAINIDGAFPGTLKYGAIIDRAFGRDDIMINSNKFLVGQGKLKYDIFFVKPFDNRELLVPVSAEFVNGSIMTLTEKMLNILLEDYTSFGLYSQIPQGTLITNASIESNNILQISFSKELVNYGGGSAREIALLNQLLYTYAQINGVDKVKISIDQLDDILPEGTELGDPFVVSKFINVLENN